MSHHAGAAHGLDDERHRATGRVRNAETSMRPLHPEAITADDPLNAMAANGLVSFARTVARTLQLVDASSS